MRIRELTAAFSYVVCLWSLACYWGLRAKPYNSVQAVNDQDSPS